MKAIPQAHRIEFSEDEREALIAALDRLMRGQKMDDEAAETLEELIQALYECDHS
jgi:hypothetical protein